VSKKISVVKILVLLIIVLIVMGAIVVGGLYVLNMGAGEAETETETKTSTEAPPELPQETTAAPSKEMGTVELKPFIVNLADEGTYLKVTMALGYGSPEHQKLLEDKITVVRDAILTVLSSKSSQTLATKHGKMKLKEDIKKALNSIHDLRGVVTSVYFTEFQIL